MKKQTIKDGERNEINILHEKMCHATSEQIPKRWKRYCLSVLHAMIEGPVEGRVNTFQTIFPTSYVCAGVCSEREAGGGHVTQVFPGERPSWKQRARHCCWKV